MQTKTREDKVVINYRVTPEAKRQIDTFAKMYACSQGEFVEKLIWHWAKNPPASIEVPVIVSVK